MSSFLRRLVTLVLAVLAPLGTAPAPVVAQGSTGRIEGHVKDQAGAPLGNAQVTVVGTAYNATTDRRGHYFIDHVPPGGVSMRAAFVGYKPVQVVNVEVHIGKITVQDFALEKTVVQLSEVTVVEAQPSMMARDQVSTRQRATAKAAEQRPARERAEKAPVDRVDHVLAQQPGVVASPSGNTAVRGGRIAAQEFNTEEYHRIEDNRFLAAAANPLSTFSIDVDRASYANVRRFLTSGQLPPPDAVRIEELVNYFPYGYPDVEGKHPVAIATDVAPAPWSPRHLLVRIGVQGRRLETAKLPPSNLTFLLDVSGSMMSPDKLPLVKQAFRLLVNELRPQDRVAIVVYAGAAGLVLPSTPGNRKEEILDAIDRLEAGGSTAGGAGLQLAYDVAKQNFVRGGNNRVVLATDGDFNVGASSEGELLRLIEQRREEGTYLTVLGFGTGNYKDAKMEQLADKGNGNYAYVDDLLEARKVFVHELGATLVTIAKDVKLQVEFNPARVQAYRLIGYENRMLAKEDFNDDRKDAGEMGAGHTVTALYEIVPVGMPLDVAVGDVDSLRYRPVAAIRPSGITATRAQTDEWLTVKLRYKDPQGGASRLLEHPVRARDERLAAPAGDFGWSAAVASFGMLLRHSEYRGAASWDQVLRLARASRGDDPDGYRAEFIRLAEMAQTLDLQASARARPE